jgi:glucose/mannose-6-phosphate isomerase
MQLKSTKQTKVQQSIDLLSQQIESGWFGFKKVNPPAAYKKFDNLVVCGMGGSQIGFHLVRDALAKELSFPIIINSNYNLPNFVNRQSLVVLSSYSGDTAEALSCAQQVIKRRLRGVVMTSGGQLARLVVDKKLPGIIFKTDLNPSGAPRWGLGYSIGGFLGLLNKLTGAPRQLPQFINDNRASNQKKMADLAKKLAGKQILVVAAEHLRGNAHVLVNQINESADNLAFWLPLPELGHHFLEALSFPREVVKKNLAILFLTSKKYSTPITKQIGVLDKIFKKRGLLTSFFPAPPQSLLSESLSTLQAGSNLCYYICVANRVDPAATPWVEVFKKMMAAKE